MQQARSTYANALQINNPSFNSTCGLGIAPWGAGDTLVAVITLDMQAATDNSWIKNTVSAAGFTVVPTTIPMEVGNLQLVVMYRRLTSAPSSVTFTWNPSPESGQRADPTWPYVPAMVVLHAFSGARLVDPVVGPIGYGLPDGTDLLVDPGLYSSVYYPLPAPGGIQVVTFANRGAAASASIRMTSAVMPTLSGCNSDTVGRYGRLIGTSIKSPNDESNLTVATFTQPLSLLPGYAPQAYRSPKTGRDALGMSFIVSP